MSSGMNRCGGTLALGTGCAECEDCEAERERRRTAASDDQLRKLWMLLDSVRLTEDESGALDVLLTDLGYYPAIVEAMGGDVRVAVRPSARRGRESQA